MRLWVIGLFLAIELIVNGYTQILVALAARRYAGPCRHRARLRQVAPPRLSCRHGESQALGALGADRRLRAARARRPRPRGRAAGLHGRLVGRGRRSGLLRLAGPVALATGMRLGTAIANVFTRGPGHARDVGRHRGRSRAGRFILGIGAGSQPIVEAWNGGRFDAARPRACARSSRWCERRSPASASSSGQGAHVDGFRLVRPPARRCRSTWPRCGPACCAWPARSATA